MFKFLFLLLLFANGMLFAYHQGHLEKLFPSGREPARLGKQINADKFKLVPPPATAVSSGTPGADPTTASMAADAAAAQSPRLLDCTEIGSFPAAEAKRFEARVAESSLAGKLSRRAVQENSTHMILIPPKEGKEGADRRAGELRRLGISDFYVIQENTNQRWGISLGIFRSEEAARTRLAALNQQGVRNAQLIEYNMQLTRAVFQLREPDGETHGALMKLKAEFPRQEIRACSE